MAGRQRAARASVLAHGYLRRDAQVLRRRVRGVPVAITYHRLYMVKWGATQTGAAAYNRLTLAATALDVWANVDAHEEICQALFAPLDPLGQYQDVFLVNAYATRPMKFRLYGATTATVYATAKSGTGSGVLAYPWFMGKL